MDVIVEDGIIVHLPGVYAEHIGNSGQTGAVHTDNTQLLQLTHNGLEPLALDAELLTIGMYRTLHLTNAKVDGVASFGSGRCLRASVLYQLAENGIMTCAV